MAKTIVVANDADQKTELENHLVFAEKLPSIEGVYEITMYNDLTQGQKDSVDGTPPFDVPPQIKS